jgi:hypothetical protein
MVVRRGRLVDVPSVARLVGEAPIGAAPALEQPEAQRLLRLVLTHVGIGFGEIWVGHLDAGLRAAVVLLPPPDESVERQLRTALRLGSAVGPETLGPEIALPPGHWLLLPVGHDAGPVLHRALAALDVRGVPVCALPGQADDVLPALGFADPKGRGLLRRPAAQRPRRSIEAG